MSKRRVKGSEIIGRTIVGYDPGYFDNGRGGIAGNPRITLDDGSVVYFVTDETEQMEYGTSVYRELRGANK